MNEKIRAMNHVTAIRNGGLYGHTTDHCDEAGCAGDERYLGPVRAGVSVGDVIDDPEGGSGRHRRNHNHSPGATPGGRIGDAMTIILKNDFHNTRCALSVTTYSQRTSDGTILDCRLSAYQVRRARKLLCGMGDCSCGDTVGMRGPNEWGVEEPLKDGGVILVCEKVTP